MSSSPNQYTQPSKSSSARENQPEDQAAIPPKQQPSSETSEQSSDVTSQMTSSSDSSETMPLVAPNPTDSASPDSSASSEPSAEQINQSTVTRQQPIPPPSEPMQYRAIGLLRGRYTPEQEQFTRGTLITEDGTAINAVLLGRVMSLVKKHLDLEQNHLWVVYPRTREKENDLHAQIVGVWEPENLGKSEPSSDVADDTSVETEPTSDYFSIRGEVIFQSEEEEQVVVKIQQSARKESDQDKAFKLNLKGVLQGRAVGYFWDLQVQRQSDWLVIQEGKSVALVPPKRKPKGQPRRGPSTGGRKRWSDQRPTRSGDRPTPVKPPVRREPIAKPVKRKSSESESSPE